MRSTDTMWDFPVMDGVTFPNANRVHPLMQRRIEKILREISKDPNICKVIVYGSSLEFHCNSASDIDLYIEKFNSDKKLASFPDLDCETDIITNLPKDNKLYLQIMKTGLLLFERAKESERAEYPC